MANGKDPLFSVLKKKEENYSLLYRHAAQLSPPPLMLQKQKELTWCACVFFQFLIPRSEHNIIVIIVIASHSLFRIV